MMRALAVLLLAAPAFAQTTVGDTLPASSSPAAEWRWQSGIGGAGGNMYRLALNDGFSLPWQVGMASYAQGPGARPNVVVSEGWNCGANGSPVPSDGYLCDSREQHYAPGDGLPPRMEWNLGMGPGNGQPGTRFLSAVQFKAVPHHNQLWLFARELGIGLGDNAGSGAALVYLAGSGANRHAQINSPNGTRIFDVADGYMLWRSGAAEMQLEADGLRVNRDVRPLGNHQGSLGTAHGNPALEHRFAKAAIDLPNFGDFADCPPCNGGALEGTLCVVKTGGVPNKRTRAYLCMYSESTVPQWVELPNAGP